MFHLFRRTPDSQPSPGTTPTQAHPRRLLWGVATLFGGMLIFALALFPLPVAASPASGAGAVSSSTTLPLLKLVPTVVDPDHTDFYCKVLPSSTSVCHVRLTEKIDSSRSLHWFTRSDVSLKPTPSSGNLSPGQSVEVKITVNLSTCLGGPSVYFIGPKNVVSVIVFCD